MHLYKFEVPLTDGDLPENFTGFLKYAWLKNPGVWMLIIALDIFHHSRYPVAFIILGKIIDILRVSDTAQGIPPGARHWLIFLPCYLFIAELAHVWVSWLFVHWRPRLRSAIRADFFNYAMRHSHSYFQDHFAGSVARKVSELAEGALRMHDIFRNQIFFAMISMSTSLIFMFTIDKIYAFCMAAYIVSVTLPLAFRLKRIRARSFRHWQQRSHVAGLIVDTFTNMQAVKSFAGTDRENRLHGTASDAEARYAAKLIRNMAQIENARRLCIIAFSSGMAFLACQGWAQDWITVGQAATITTFSFTIAGVTWQLGSGIVQMVDEIGGNLDALSTITGRHKIEDKPGAQKLAVEKGEISYARVEFSYGSNIVFDRMDLHVAPGEKIALIGPSGAGKTTFINLLLRLYDIDGGAIRIDGQDIRDVTQDSLREHIAVIPQDTALFHRSLMENIRYGRRDASDAEVIEAARRAHADEFISALPEKYDTLVGERGIKLSGGQRQRIAIARAPSQKMPPILVLDEATSALDSESERLIQQALQGLMEGKTVIAIAHRLSTIARMDRILVFENGVVIEQGDHQSLLDRKGLYAKLWSLQSGGFLHEDLLNTADLT